LKSVEVKIDDNPWQAATIHNDHNDPCTWRFWTFDWGTPAAGEHSVSSRAFDVHGAVQPPPGDAYLAARRTYWENNGQMTRHVRVG